MRGRVVPFLWTHLGVELVHAGAVAREVGQDVDDQGGRQRGPVRRGRPLRAGDGRDGVTGDTIVEQVFREIRAFRIYDGPTEVHKWSLAKKIKRDHLGARP